MKNDNFNSNKQNHDEWILQHDTTESPLNDQWLTERFADPKKILKVIPMSDAAIACVGCGAYWGHPDKDLDFPNRFKVDEWCKCYNPKCEIAYYDPFTGEFE